MHFTLECWWFGWKHACKHHGLLVWQKYLVSVIELFLENAAELHRSFVTQALVVEEIDETDVIWTLLKLKAWSSSFIGSNVD